MVVLCNESTLTGKLLKLLKSIMLTALASAGEIVSQLAADAPFKHHQLLMEPYTLYYGRL